MDFCVHSNKFVWLHNKSGQFRSTLSNCSSLNRLIVVAVLMCVGPCIIVVTEE